MWCEISLATSLFLKSSDLLLTCTNRRFLPLRWLKFFHQRMERMERGAKFCDSYTHHLCPAAAKREQTGKELHMLKLSQTQGLISPPYSLAWVQITNEF